MQLKKWLHSAAKFIIFNRGRNKTNNEIPISDDIEDIPVTSIELPDNIAVSNESVDKIKKEINNLDYKYRNVITMKFGDKYSTHEIADMFNISIKTVYTLVALGKTC
ncbi:MAG: sigma-70 family RNA polymerase sigma factor [Clostridia bacterium]|nr:sigma-70 family RNA polymerase sigma factor [Clostridia bacterium]